MDPLVGVIMGSKSDWETLRHADEVLSQFGVAHECRIVSAHRTPVDMAEYAGSAASRGLEVIIAGAGGSAHLPGMVAAHCILPVLGVPVATQALGGVDSLLSIVQMPGGVPVGDSGEGERRFRRERERHSGPKANSSRSVATLALRLCKKCSASSRETYPERSEGTAALAVKGARGKGRSPCPRLSTH